ncbi:hypothetical protein SRABI106_03139 [Rahnella aquatilis]|nr:hypothetical protein SRABI106_03139 [Rahnella aquatilis]
MIEVDSEVQRETIKWFELGPLITVFNTHGIFDAQEFLRAVQLFNPCIHQQIDERCSTAVHNRHFRRIDFDNNIIDAQAS